MGTSLSATWIYLHTCRGALFFGPGFRVTRNKLTFRDNLAQLLETASPTNRQLEKLFKEWLSTCHRELDRSVRFEVMCNQSLQVWYTCAQSIIVQCLADPYYYDNMQTVLVHLSSTVHELFLYLSLNPLNPHAGLGHLLSLDVDVLLAAPGCRPRLASTLVRM